MTVLIRWIDPRKTVLVRGSDPTKKRLSWLGGLIL